MACGAGQFLLDFFGVGQPLGDALAALGQDLENGLVGELGQAKSDDGEADDLGNKMRPDPRPNFSAVSRPVWARSLPMLAIKIK